MLDIRFTVPGLPIAQPRQRHRIVSGHVSNYTPGDHPVNAFKAVVKIMARSAYAGRPLAEGPILLTLTFVFPRPKSMIWKKRPMPREWAPKKPDFDNLGKSVSDALNEVIWQDDAQVVSSRIYKLYAAGGEGSHTVIEIAEATPIADMTGGMTSEYA